MNTHRQNWTRIHDLRNTVLRLLLLASLAVAALADWQWSDHVDILGPTGQESIVAFPQVGGKPPVEPD